MRDIQKLASRSGHAIGLIVSRLRPRKEIPTGSTIQADGPDQCTQEESDLEASPFCKQCKAIPLEVFQSHEPRFVYQLHASMEDWKASAAKGCPSCALFRGVDPPVWRGVDKPYPPITIGRSKGGQEELAVYIGDRQGISLPFLTEGIPGAQRIAEYAHKQANGVKRQSIGNVGLFPHSLSVSAESDEVVRIIRKLIDVCCGQHPFCTSVPHPGTPSRLLDVGTPEEQQLRLVPWDVYSLHERPYLTLSYCWGGVPMDAPWKLTTTNLEQFMVSIPIEALPLTLREAVLLTRRLGERYIWIDSLCIIQNDRSDWVRQSSSMSRIYSGSLCTLSAASDHSNGGLFAERNSPPATTLELSPFHGGPPRKVLLYPQHRCGSDHYFQCTDKPGVYSRAWCLQERELSCRVLQFTTQEFIWKCRTEDAKECEIVGFMEARKLLSLGEPDFIDVNVSLERYSITSRDDRVKIGNYVIFKHHEYAQKLRRFYEYWYNILTEYTAASISNHADRLPALSGLAQAHPVGRGNTYLAGLWKHDIRTGLSWKSRRRQNEDGSNQHYACNLPSWSPLRSDLGGVFFSSREQTRKTVFSPVLLKAVIVHSTSDLFGHINSGYLTFKGYIVECRLCDYSDYHYMYRKNEELRFDPRRAKEKDEHGGTRLNDYLYEIDEMKNIGNIRFDASEGKQCYPVVFYVHLGMPEGSYCGEYEEYWYAKYTEHEPKKSVGLVVIKVSHPDHSNAYMRIGIVEGNIEPVFSSFKESIFTLL